MVTLLHGLKPAHQAQQAVRAKPVGLGVDRRLAGVLGRFPSCLGGEPERVQLAGVGLEAGRGLYVLAGIAQPAGLEHLDVMTGLHRSSPSVTGGIGLSCPRACGDLRSGPCTRLPNQAPASGLGGPKASMASLTGIVTTAGRSRPSSMR